MICLSVLNGRKNASKKKKASSLSNPANLPTNEIRNPCKHGKNLKEGKLYDLANDNLNEDNLNIILTEQFIIVRGNEK